MIDERHITWGNPPSKKKFICSLIQSSQWQVEELCLKENRVLSISLCRDDEIVQWNPMICCCVQVLGKGETPDFQIYWVAFRKDTLTRQWFDPLWYSELQFLCRQGDLSKVRKDLYLHNHQDWPQWKLSSTFWEQPWYWLQRQKSELSNGIYLWNYHVKILHLAR